MTTDDQGRDPSQDRQNCFSHERSTDCRSTRTFVPQLCALMAVYGAHAQIRLAELKERAPIRLAL